MRAEVAPRAARCRESDHADAHDHHDFQHREDQLEFSRPLHADVVQPGDQGGGCNRDQLSVADDERRSYCGIVKERQGRESPENAHDSRGDGRNRCRLGNREPGPGIQEAGQWSVGVADVDVLAAGLRLHRAQLGVGDRPRHRQDAADNPRQVHQLGRADRLHHLGRNQEDAAADDGAHHNRACLAHAQFAQQGGGLGICVSQLCHLPCGAERTSDWTINDGAIVGSRHLARVVPSSPSPRNSGICLLILPSP